MGSAASRVGHVICLAALVTLTTPEGALAQATGTINGRVLDQAEAVLPGVTVTATNVNTGVTRSTVTNAEGFYSLPGLEPGLYTLTTELTGFASIRREGVSLTITATVTIDLMLGLAPRAETVTVAGQAPLIEVTQSKVTATIRTQEVENLPLLNRRLTGLIALLPGAKEVTPYHYIKRQQGTVSIAGSTGRNYVPLVDGADNRDNVVGGAMMNFTVEGLEEFRVAMHQFSAADGRTGGAAVSLLTKSGTNQPHGSAFFFGRDRALTVRDYFTARDNLPEQPFNRQQYGGSFGGPIVRNRAFYFGAYEGIRESTSISIPDQVYREIELLVPFGAKPTHTISEPYRDRMYTIKSNVQLTSNHSLTGRFAGQKLSSENSLKTQRFMSDLSSLQEEGATYWDAVVQHSWVGGSRALNQFTVHRSHMYGFSDFTGVNGRGFHRNYPDEQALPILNNLIFPSFSIGNPTTGGDYAQDTWQIRNDLTLQVGRHSLRMGGDYSWMPLFGGQCCRYWGRLSFFDDPSTIVNNTNGRYPQGFQTPGIVRTWFNDAEIHTNVYQLNGTSQVKAYIQDDWRIGPRLTLNLGVRYDVDRNFYDQTENEQNLTYQVLRAIGSPYAPLPRTPAKDLSPRVGFAYNIGGDGKRVLKGGYGLYFDGTAINTHYNIFIQNHRPVTFTATRTNTAIGVGELPALRLGIDPLPEQPTNTDRFPRGARSGGYWFDPNITDPRTHQYHIGYTHELGPNTVFSADYSLVLGRNDFRALEINPIINGVRRLAPALAEAFGDPNLIGPLQIQASINRNQYNELALLFERRMPRTTFRATYVLSGAYAYAGEIAGSAYFVPAPQDWDAPFAESEWGPTGTDERHRIVLFGVFDLPYGLQLSPIFRAATARPYNLLAGVDLNGDGQLNDRWIDPASGQQVHINAARGDPFVQLDMRATKFFTLGRDLRLGAFAEMFNVFNTANFGDVYQGNARSSLFRQPVGFLGGRASQNSQVTYPFTLQLGARLEF